MSFQLTQWNLHMKSPSYLIKPLDSLPGSDSAHVPCFSYSCVQKSYFGRSVIRFGQNTSISGMRSLIGPGLNFSCLLQYWGHEPSYRLGHKPWIVHEWRLSGSWQLEKMFLIRSSFYISGSRASSNGTYKVNLECKLQIGSTCSVRIRSRIWDIVETINLHMMSSIHFATWRFGPIKRNAQYIPMIVIGNFFLLD